MLCRSPKTWSGPLFWFPANVNAVNARFTALQVVVVCILGIIFRYNEIMRYAIAGMCFDFILRCAICPPRILQSLSFIHSTRF
jgi:hypothetical protein